MTLDLTRLRGILHDVEAALARADVDALRRFTGEFQLAVFRAARNDYLYGLLSSIQEKIRNQRNSTVTLPGRDEEVGGFCRDLMRAIG